MAKLNPLSEGALAAIAVLEGAEGPMTLQEINDSSDIKIASAHLTAAARRGLVASEKVEKEVVSVRTVNAYSLTGEVYEAPEAE